MKLVVQIPCLNEEETLPLVLQSIPRRVEGVDEIVVLVIDDGSTCLLYTSPSPRDS